MENKKIEIDFKRIFRELIQKLWLICLITAIVLGASLVLIQDSDNVQYYTANATIYSVANGSYKQSIEGTYAMKDYAEIIGTLKVSERAALLLGDDDIDGFYIMKSISSHYSEDSAILTISAKDTNPDLAMHIANAVANAFVIEMRSITGNQDVQLLDEAYTYYDYSDGGISANVKRLALVILAFLFVCFVIAINDIFTSKLKTVRECTLNGELELLGMIPIYKNQTRKEVDS